MCQNFLKAEGGRHNYADVSAKQFSDAVFYSLRDGTLPKMLLGSNVRALYSAQYPVFCRAGTKSDSERVLFLLKQKVASVEPQGR